MLAPMRIVVDIRREYEKLLERDAATNHRTTREHAAYLLHLKLKELAAESPHITRADTEQVA